jgi:hypothetical protein
MALLTYIYFIFLFYLHSPPLHTFLFPNPYFLYCILYMNMCIISNKILLKKLPFIQSFHWLVRDSSAVRWLFSTCCSRGTSADLPTDPLLAGNTRKNAISRPAAGHTRKNALSPAPNHDPRRVIVFTRKITHQKLMPKII